MGLHYAFLGLGLACLGLALYTTHLEWLFLRTCVQVQARLVDWYTKPTKRYSEKSRYHLVLEFKDAQGRAYQTQSRKSMRTPTGYLGEVYEVVYDPEYPQDSRLKGFWQGWSGTIGALFFAMLFLYLAFATKR
jgi:hypothetical protein